MSLSKADIKKIREVQCVLQSLKDGNNPFFNITVYERNGLIERVGKWEQNIAGKRVKTGFTCKLTEKAHRILNVII